MVQTTYLVTGASKGIGRALSVLMAKEGIRVVLLSRESPELLEATSMVQHHAPKSFSVECDLADPTSIQSAASTILDEVGELSGIVHNAGDIRPIEPLLEAKSVDWSRAIQVNLLGVQQLTSAISQLLCGASHTRITTISSGASLRPLPSWSAYCVAKAGLDMWARCLAEEGRQQNISAISIAPGIVDTDMQQTIRASSPENFPLRSTFVDYHANGDLTKPIDVALKLLPLILRHTMEDSGQRFDVRDL
jgi:benzil reductase ((S)-benzoin forming)